MHACGEEASGVFIDCPNDLTAEEGHECMFGSHNCRLPGDIVE
jgi:hypothetical protein